MRNVIKGCLVGWMLLICGGSALAAVDQETSPTTQQELADQLVEAVERADDEAVKDILKSPNFKFESINLPHSKSGYTPVTMCILKDGVIQSDGVETPIWKNLRKEFVNHFDDPKTGPFYVTGKDKHGNTPLLAAMEKSWFRLAFKREVFIYPFSEFVHKDKSSGDTVLKIMLERGLISHDFNCQSPKNQFGQRNDLIEFAKAIPNVTSSEGETNLMVAYSYGSNLLFNKCLLKAYDFGLRDNRGNTLLHRMLLVDEYPFSVSNNPIDFDSQVCWLKNSLDIVMASENFDVNVVDLKGYTPLMRVVENNDYEHTSLLLEKCSNDLPRLALKASLVKPDGEIWTVYDMVAPLPYAQRIQFYNLFDSHKDALILDSPDNSTSDPAPYVAPQQEDNAMPTWLIVTISAGGVLCIGIAIAFSCIRQRRKQKTAMKDYITRQVTDPVLRTILFKN